MKKKEFHVVLISAFVFALSLSILYLKDIGGFSYDTGNFLFSIFHYDIMRDTPHLPGYPLYVLSLKVAFTFFQNPYFSYKMVNLTISFFTFLAAFYSFRIKFNFTESYYMTLFLFSIPYILFFHLVPESYVFDLFYSIFIFFIMQKSGKSGLTGLVYGILGGFRPSSMVLLFPFYLTLLITKRPKHKNSIYPLLRSMAGILIGFGLWFIPMVISQGGIRHYLNLYVFNNPMERLTLLQNFSRFVLYSWTFLLVIAVLLFSLILRKLRRYMLDSADTLPHLVLLITSLIFFAFFHFSKGYALIIGFSAVYLIGILVKTAMIRLQIIKIWLILNISFFFLTPYRLPSPDCYKSASARTQNPLQIAGENAFSFYLTAYSHIRYLEDSFQQISLAIQKSLPDSGRVFIGPMIPISIRNLAFKFPEIYFYRVRPGHSKIMEVYHFDTKSVLSDTSLQNLYILVRNDNPIRSRLKGTTVYHGRTVTCIVVKQIHLKNLTLWHLQWLDR
jgi:hypothetical protein